MRLLLLSVFILIPTGLFSQNITDELVIKQYHIGKYHVRTIEVQEKVAENWGFTIENYDSDGKDTLIIKLAEKQNEIVYKKLANKFGFNWQVVLNKQVDLILKKTMIETETLKKKFNIKTDEERLSINFTVDKKFAIHKKTVKDVLPILLGKYIAKQDLVDLYFDDGTVLTYFYDAMEDSILLK